MSFTVKGDSRRVVTVETPHFRERQPGELIHYSPNEGQDCIICGLLCVVWTDDQELWQRHAFRCL